MKTLLATILLSSGLHAQNALWIDLSGPWLSRAGEDRPEFAQPGFDDRDWTPYILPARALEPRPGYLWLRKTIDLPTGSNGNSLALTLGTWNQAYEVFVNGTLAGASAGNMTVRGFQIPRPQTFLLPPIEKPRITIAIRSLSAHRFPVIWRGEAQGPFLLTGTAQAPAELAASYFNRLRVLFMADVAVGLLSGGLGFLLLLAWLGERSRKPLFWFAVSLLAQCSMTLLRMGGLLAETFYPYRWLLIERLFASLTIMALISFVASVYEFRGSWIRVLIWLSPLPPLVARWTGNGLHFQYLSAILCLAAIPFAAFGWWRSQFKFGRRQVLLAATLCTAFLIFANTYFYVGLFLPRLLLGPLSIYLFQLSVLILAIPISWELLTRLREDGLERERLNGEMQAARLVQQFFLAERPGHIDVVYEPAHEVGGDFAFTFPLPDGSQLIATGDVSGKGLKAAMTVSLIAGALRNRRSDEPAEVLAELNGALPGGLGFVTAIVVRCDETGSLRMACAGHPAPYLAGRECEVEAGLPLGITADTAYAERTARLDPGQQLTLVSDGVVEAENERRELFGFDRTREISTKPAREIAEVARAWGQNDDITVVTVRRKNA